MSDYIANANAIIAQLKAVLPAGVRIDRAKSGDNLATMFDDLPAVVLLLDTSTPRPEPRPTGTRRQNVDRVWSVYVAGKDPDDAAGAPDVYTLLEAVDNALRGFRVVPEGPMEAGVIQANAVLVGGLVYKQTWTYWKQGSE